MLRALLGQKHLGLQRRGFRQVALAKSSSGIAFVENSRDSSVNRVRAARQSLRDILEKGKITSRHSPRPLAADKFHAPVFPNFFYAPDENHSNLPRAANMRPSAGLYIDTLNLHRAQDPFPLRFPRTPSEARSPAVPYRT